jgi:uncharacterized protein YcbK (DUF882 family)
MKKRKIILRIILWIISIIFILFISFTIYSNSLIGVNKTTIGYYKELKEEIVKSGYSEKLVVISGKRNVIINTLLTKFGSATKNSRHLKGEAIDVLILDINQDGIANYKDVDIVYSILNEKIIKNKGGIGTYKNKNGFFTRQMVHFDCRGYKARWKR